MESLAGAQKQYELLFKLAAQLAPNFNGTFKKAIETQKKLQNSINGVNSLQSKIDGYTKNSKAIDQQKEKLSRLSQEKERLNQKIQTNRNNMATLQAKIQETGDSTGQLTAQLAAEQRELEKNTDKLGRNKQQIQQTTAKIEQQEQKLNTLGQELEKAGVNTGNLTKENERLQSAYDKLRTSQERIGQINEQQQKVKDTIASTKGELLRTTGTLGAIAAAVYAGPVKSAMSFESNMAEVAKVVDWLKDDTGATTKQYTDLEKRILSLSSKIPMTAEEISEIMAAAGQSNVATNNKELTEFTEGAAKMGIAFDISAEQAGDWMAKWRTSFKMSQKEVITLSDQINYLSNTSAANASQISSIVTKIGPLGEVAGLASGEIAALGATLVSVGVNEDVAATGIKKVMTVMTAGSAATKRQTGVLNKLGLSATDLAKHMQTDAQGAILQFLEAVKKLPKAEQAAALKNYFGEEAVAAIAPLLTNLPYLREEFKKVGDASQYAGSMEAEYAARADTNENKLQLAKNSIQALSTTLGQAFLPVVGDAAEKIAVMANALTDFAAANPGAIQSIGKAVAVLGGLKVASLVAKLGILEIKSTILDFKKLMELLKFKTAETAVESVGFGTKIAGVGERLKGAGSSLKTYLTEVKGSFGGLKEAAGSIFADNFIVTKITGLLSTARGKMLGGIGAIGNVLRSAVTSIGTGTIGILTTVFQGLAGKIGGLAGMIGTALGNNAIITVIASKLSGGFGKIATLAAPLGNVFKTILAPLANLAGPIGGIVGKVLPIVGVVTTLIAVFKLLKNHLQDIRNFIQSTFGDEALKVFDTMISAISGIGNVISTALSGGVDKARTAIQSLFGDAGAKQFDVFIQSISQIMDVFGAVTDAIAGFLEAAAPSIFAIIQSIATFMASMIGIVAGFIAAIMPTISEIAVFLQTYVLPILQEIFNFIAITMLPTIATLIQTILPTITTIIAAILPVIQVGLQTIWTVAQPILAALVSGTGAAIQAILPILTSIVSAIRGVLQGIQTVLQGIIQFVRGVFTGQWGAAWRGIQTAFKGVWQAITSIARGAIGTIKGLISGVTGMIGKIGSAAQSAKNFVGKVLGGGGSSKKSSGGGKVKKHARGTASTDDTFIAGENGPELVTNAPHRSVYTAAQTENLFAAQRAAQKAAEVQKQTASVQSNPPAVAGSGNGTNKNVTINITNNVEVNGNEPGDIDEKLKANNESIMQQIDEKLDADDDDERRTRYE